MQAALDKVSVDKTTLIIAHKLATVRQADNIVVMSEGRIVEQGTHRQLLDKGGAYAALVRAQDLGSQTGTAEAQKQEAQDEELERRITLERTKTETKPDAVEDEIQYLTQGTVGFGLIHSIALMFAEHKDLYIWFFLSGIACLIGGGTYPAQALIFSRLINVFTLTGQEAQNRADFFALMFLVVALANLFAYFVVGYVY